MGANEKHAAAFHGTLHPDGPSGVPAVLAAADTIRDRVLGFLVQCETCPQKAITATQPDQGWICPRCAEVTDTADDRNSLNHYTYRPAAVMDDDYPIGKVQG